MYVVCFRCSPLPIVLGIDLGWKRCNNLDGGLHRVTEVEVMRCGRILLEHRADRVFGVHGLWHEGK